MADTLTMWLVIATFALAVGTFLMAWFTWRLSSISRKDYRATRLPAIDLRWDMDAGDGGAIITFNPSAGREEAHGIVTVFQIHTLSPNTPTFLEYVVVETAPVPPDHRTPVFTVLSRSQPLLYLNRDGWTDRWTPIPLQNPESSGEPRRPLRLVRISAGVSTVAADALAERWTSLSVVTDGVDFDVERRLPFLRETDRSFSHRWENALRQILDEAMVAERAAGKGARL